MHTLFGRPIELGPGLSDESTYTFTLEAETAAAAAPSGAAPVRLKGKGAVAAFQPNLTVVRVRQEGRTLERFADEQRAAMAARLPEAKLAREGKTRIAGHAALEREYAFPADGPLPGIAQWHAALLRDGWFYLFCASAPRERFERDRERFKAVVESWK